MDRAPWWQVIALEHWDHRVVMTLLQAMDEGLFGDMPVTEPPDYPEDE